MQQEVPSILLLAANDEAELKLAALPLEVLAQVVSEAVTAALELPDDSLKVRISRYELKIFECRGGSAPKKSYINPDDVLDEDTPIEHLPLQNRVVNFLRRSGVMTVRDALRDLRDGQYREWRNVGKLGRAEVLQVLKEKGFLPEDYQVP